MIAMLRRLFGKRKSSEEIAPVNIPVPPLDSPIRPDQVDSPDPGIRAIVAECMNTDQVMIGGYDDDGNFFMKPWTDED